MNSLFVRPDIFKAFPEVVAVQSTRHGGVSDAPFSSLNLSYSTGDTPESVRQNRRRFFGGLGITEDAVVSSVQVHGDQILHASKGGHYDGYDAFITDQKQLFLSVSIADCVPILIYDPTHQAVAAVHAGWRGTVEQIVGKTILAMQEKFGTLPEACAAYIGTAIAGEDYQVGEEVACHFDPAHTRKEDAPGKFLLDLKAANRDQLRIAGLRDNQVEVSPFSTYQYHQDFFSYRQSGGKTGRMMAVIGIQ
ncbi:MAG: peptidoglycan editing factor PgeF [Chlorobiales bacterium]|nr:peptidoglycan editing factor PgeF [Chlorobiales bacterium]